MGVYEGVGFMIFMLFINVSGGLLLWTFVCSYDDCGIGTRTNLCEVWTLKTFCG